MRHKPKSRTIPHRDVAAKDYRATPTQANLMAAAIATAEHGIVHSPGERRDFCEHCKKLKNGE